MKAINNNFQGYIFSRSINGSSIPQKVQGIIIRNYCIKNNLNYLFGSIEYSIEDSYIILNNLVNSIDKYRGLVFYSFFQLPGKKNVREIMYKKILQYNKEVHFVMEDLVIKRSNYKDTIKQIESCIIINAIIAENSDFNYIKKINSL
jgi:sporadic carbohydrate cluster protein (TIGR04323 family)